MAKLLLAIGLVLAMQAQAASPPKRYEGRVQRFDAQSGKIFLSLVDHSTGNWTVLPQAKVFGADHKPAARTAIRPGAEVAVAVSEDGNVQTVWLQESACGKPFAGGKIKRWDGKITIKKREPVLSFDLACLSGRGRMSFNANPKTRVIFAGVSGEKPRPGTLQDVQSGQTVYVLLATASHQVTEVEIRE